MFETLCGREYKSERGIKGHNASRCQACWALRRAHEVATNMLASERQRDITKKQAAWLDGLRSQGGIQTHRFNSRSRRWFTIPGEPPIQVVIWPNGAGFIARSDTLEETAQREITRVADSRQDILDSLDNQWETLTPEQQEGLTPIREQLRRDLGVTA